MTNFLLEVEKLTKESILEDQVFAELLDLGDELERKKLEIKLLERARGLKVLKQFNDLLRIFRSQNEKVNQGLIQNITENHNAYWNSRNQQVTDFTLKVIKFIDCIDDERLSYHEVQITTSRGTTLLRDFGPLSMINIDAFKKAINSNYCTFSGSQGDLDNIKKLIFNDSYHTERVVALTGYREIGDRRFFVEADKCLIDGEIKTEYTAIKNRSGILSNILDYSPITSSELKELKTHLFSFNSQAIAYAVVGYSIASLLRPKLNQIHKKTPHLLVVGEAGSGKSETIDNILCSLLGITEVCSAGGMTKFGLDKKLSSNTSVPLILNEYKPYMMTKNKVNTISDAIRNSYDGYVVGRGDRTGELQEYKLSTGIVLVGEASTSETAVLDRSILVVLSKKESMVKEHTASYKWLVEHKELLTKLTRRLLPRIVDMDLKELSKIFAQSERMVSKQITSSRVRDCIAACITGLSVLNLLLRDIPLESAAIYLSTNLIEEAGGGSNKSIIDLTIEEINDALPKIMKSLRDDPYNAYEIINNGDELALRVPALYPELTKYSKAYDTGFIALNQKEFIRQLRKSEYFIDYRTVKFQIKEDLEEDFPKNKLKNKPIKAYVLDANKLRAANLNIDNFVEISR